MINPYQLGSRALSVGLLRRHVLRFMLLGVCSTAITFLIVALALYLLNQGHQVIRTETSFFLVSINGIPVSNESVAWVSLAGGGFLGIVAFACFWRALRNYCINSELLADIQSSSW